MIQFYFYVAGFWGVIYAFGYMSFWIKTQTKFPLPETDSLYDIIMRGIVLGVVTVLVAFFAAVLMPLTFLEHIYKKIKERVKK